MKKKRVNWDSYCDNCKAKLEGSWEIVTLNKKEYDFCDDICKEGFLRRKKKLKEE